jgi:hypothetical protein
MPSRPDAAHHGLRNHSPAATNEGTDMNQTAINPFQLPSTAVALMRVGFGTWATQVIVAKELTQATLQWSSLTRDAAMPRPVLAFSTPSVYGSGA